MVVIRAVYIFLSMIWLFISVLPINLETVKYQMSAARDRIASARPAAGTVLGAGAGAGAAAAPGGASVVSPSFPATSKIRSLGAVVPATPAPPLSSGACAARAYKRKLAQVTVRVALLPAC